MNYKFLKIFLIFNVFHFQLILAQKCQNLYGKTKYDGECLNVAVCIGAALIGNCPNIHHICCINDQSPSLFSGFPQYKENFLKIVGNTTRNHVIYHYLAESMQAAQIDTEYKMAAYLSQLAEETSNFEQLESTTSEADIDSDIGNSQFGDGSLYRGRGGIYLRGKNNYELAERSLGLGLINSPEKAAFPSVAFKIAAWYWKNNSDIYDLSSNKTKKGSFNDIIDGTYLSFSLLTNSLTSDSKKFLKRLEINDMILSELNFRPLKKSRGLGCMLNGKQGYNVPICLAQQNSFYCGCEGDFEKKETCNYGQIKNGKCLNPNFVRCCVENYSTNIDLVIVMDNSGSIGPTYFQIEKDFVISLIQNFEIGLNKSRVAVIHFSDTAKIVTSFNQTSNSLDLINKVQSISFDGFSTNTSDALILANNTILQEVNGMRSIEEGIPKVIVVITDGVSNDRIKTLEAAQVIKDRGYNIIAAGVGWVDQEECKLMSSTPYDFEYGNDLNDLDDILFNIASKSIVQPALVKNLVPIRSTISKNQYKYFKYPLGNLTQFIIQLDQLLGNSSLFYSFVNRNPKDDSDLISFQSLRRKRETQTQIKFFNINIPTEGIYDNLYISVKGYDTLNSFEMKLSEKTALNHSETTITSQSETNATSQSNTTTTSNGQEKSSMSSFLIFILILCGNLLFNEYI
ncbi:unnamed protein product [Brachionus calyciflorus]|uniref:VWFA domain-containing protein n=1 Tax=Brachionus calyciflorus TaxID=104777 RepID=A0A813M5W7_9BILA|nr:unnamed protein product [Brachionus calyciflorus]